MIMKNGEFGLFGIGCVSIASDIADNVGSRWTNGLLALTLMLASLQPFHMLAGEDLRASLDEATIEWVRQYRAARLVESTAQVLFGIRSMALLDITLDPEVAAVLPPAVVATAFREGLQEAGVTITQDSSYLLSVSVEGVWLRDTYAYMSTVEVLQNVVLEREPQFIIAPVSVWGKTSVGMADRPLIMSNVRDSLQSRLSLLVAALRSGRRVPPTSSATIPSEAAPANQLDSLRLLNDGAARNRFLGYRGTIAELFELIKKESPERQLAYVAAAYPPPNEQPVEFLKRFLAGLIAWHSGEDMVYVSRNYGIDSRSENNVLWTARVKLSTGFENPEDLQRFVKMLSNHVNSKY